MGNVYMEASQINYRGGEKKMSVEEALKNTSGEAAAIAQLQQDVSDLNDVKANKITIAPVFSAEASYDPGDLVYYNGLTYRCVNSHSGEWDADDFAATTIDNELSKLRSGLTSVSASVNGVYWGAYPNGQSNGLVRVIVPLWNPDGKTASVTNAYVYDSTGAYTDIKSSAVIGNTTKSYAQVNMTFDATHAGKLLLVDVSLA